MRRLAAVAAICVTLSPISALAGRADDTLVVAIQGEVRSVDHLYTTARDCIILSELTDDTLFYADPDSRAYTPLAAASYSWLDERTIDVTLRADVTFHDGSRLDADDVVYTYDWVLSESGKTNRGRLIRSWLDRVEKLGPLKLRFHLKYPYPLALRDMAMSVQLRKKGAYHDASGRPDPNRQLLSLNGTGPYRVVAFQPGKSVTLERFDGYYRGSPKGRPAIRRIVFRSISDLGTQQAEIISGGVQWAYNIPTDVAVNIGATGFARHVSGPSLRVGFIPLDAAGFTGAGNPLTKLKVRRALNHAIDREKIVKYLVQGDAHVIESACHPDQFGCERDVRKYAYDPREARRLLAEAGYPHGFAFELWAYRERQVAEAIAADLAKVGVTARLRFVKLATLNRARRKRRVAAYFGSWASGSTRDTAVIAGVHWSLKSDRNLSGDAAVAEAVQAAARTVDRAKRKALYSEALRRIADRAYWIPLYSFSQNYLVSPSLDFPVPSDGLPRLYRARWRSPPTSPTGAGKRSQEAATRP